MQQEQRLYRNTSLNNYWFSVDRSSEKGLGSGVNISNHDRADKLLRSSREVVGYNVHALDRSMGTLTDLVIDTESWKVISLVTETSGKATRKLLLPVNIVREINWANSEVVLNLNFEQVKNVSSVFNWQIFRLVPVWQGRPRISFLLIAHAVPDIEEK